MFSAILCAIAGVVVGRGFGKRFDLWSALGLGLIFGALLGGTANALWVAALNGASFGPAFTGAALAGAGIGAFGGLYGAFIAYVRKRNRVTK